MLRVEVVCLWWRSSLNSVVTRACGLCQFYNPVCSSYCGSLTISSGKFVASLTNTLFITYHARRYVNAKVCTCQVLVQRNNGKFERIPFSLSRFKALRISYFLT